MNELTEYNLDAFNLFTFYNTKCAKNKYDIINSQEFRTKYK